MALGGWLQKRTVAKAGNGFSTAHEADKLHQALQVLSLGLLRVSPLLLTFECFHQLWFGAATICQAVAACPRFPDPVSPDPVSPGSALRHFRFLAVTLSLSASHQRRISPAKGGHDGDAVGHGGGADFDFVFSGVLATGGVDDQCHVLVLHEVDDVGALAAGELGEGLYFDAGVFEDLAGAAGGVDGEAEVSIAFGDADDVGAVGGR